MINAPRTLEEINAEFWRIVALIEAGDPRYARPVEPDHGRQSAQQTGRAE